MPAKDSTIVVPISVSIPQLRDRLNTEVPRRIYSLDPSYTWTTPPHFRILGIEVTIADKVDPPLRQAMDQVKSTLLQRAQDLQLRKSAEDLWMKAFDPVSVSSNPDVWVRFTPKEV